MEISVLYQFYQDTMLDTARGNFEHPISAKNVVSWKLGPDTQIYIDV